VHDSDGIRWLDGDDLVTINQVVINQYTPKEAAGVHDQGSLESAQRAPSLFRFYEQTEDLFLLVAILISRLIQNHPFHNGNKRTAYAAGRMVLWMNGYRLHPPQPEVIEICCALATHDVDEEQVAYWISCHAFGFDVDAALQAMPSEGLSELMSQLLSDRTDNSEV
jgi:death-on-curing protein